jgi:hypothetical protein
MAIVVEDGTGKSDAESYLSVLDATTRLGELGYSNFASVDTETGKEALLRRSTKRLDSALAAVPRGTRANDTQALVYPRDNLKIRSVWVTLGDLPQLLLDACCLLAESLSYSQESPSGGFDINVTEVEVTEGVRTKRKPGIAVTQNELRPYGEYLSAVRELTYGTDLTEPFVL